MNELALFAGAGGGILGGKLLGWRTVCAVEHDPYAAAVLAARQNDGSLPPFPIWDDVRTFRGRPWQGAVDVVSGGFPCQDISVAGTGKGLAGERSGLWREFFRIIREVGPRFAFVENSPALVGRGLGRVLGDLASIGMDARWCVLGADDAGAPHERKRIWILAYTELPERWSQTGSSGEAMADTNGLREPQSEGGEREERRWIGDSREAIPDATRIGRQEPRAQQKATGGGIAECGCSEVSDANGAGSEAGRPGVPSERPSEIAVPRHRRKRGSGNTWWAAEPAVGRMADGVAHRVDRLRCLGNGQVPAVAALAWRILTDPGFESGR